MAGLFVCPAVFYSASFYHYCFNWFKDGFTYFLFSKYCIKVFFTGRFSVLCLAVRLSWVLLFVMHWAITGVLGCSVVLAYAVCGALGYNWVLGCSVVLAYAVCGAWLGLVGAWLFGCLGWFNLWGLVGAWLFGCLGLCCC